MRLAALATVLVSLIASLAAAARRSHLVHTRYGTLRGQIIELSAGRLPAVEQFLGVPYAMPPLGRMRFMPPSTPVPWSGVRDANLLPPVCPQPPPVQQDEASALTHMSRARYAQLLRLSAHLRNQSEDCLYLNIYAPITEASYDKGTTRALLPVLVYIHGDSYVWSSGNVYDGTVLASYGRVIVVTINYRLGVLGFMKPTTSSESATSNYALLDQVAALHWINKNIQAFHGDPGQVTVMGHDTGAVCVSLLATSAVSRVSGGLFQRAILMSGSSLSPWAMTRNPDKVTIQVALALNCPMTNDSILGECLRSKTVDDLSRINLQFSGLSPNMGPAVDDVVVPYSFNNPTTLSHALSKFDLLYGITSQENFHVLNNEELSYGIGEKQRNRILSSFLRSGYSHHTSQLLAAATNLYMDAPVDVAVHRDQTLNILSDATVAAPVVRLANIHSRSIRESHMYVFSHVTRNGDYLQKFGSISGEELPYVFGAPFSSKNDYFPAIYSRSEMALSEYMMASWTNFAKTGNPNLTPKQGFMSEPNDSPFYDIIWPPYEERTQQYMDLAPKPRVHSRYRAKQLDFWNRVVPSILSTPPSAVDMAAEDVGLPPEAVLPPRRLVPGFPPPPIAPSSPPPHLFQRPVPPFLQGNYTEEQLFSVLNDLMRRVNASMAAGDVHTAGSGSGSSQSGSTGGTLSIVIVVGVCFLLLNLMILGGVYYQKQRLKARERQLERQTSLSELGGGSRTASERGSRESVGRPMLARSASGDDLLGDDGHVTRVTPAVSRESVARVTISDDALRQPRRASVPSAAPKRGETTGGADTTGDGESPAANVVRERSLDQRTLRSHEPKGCGSTTSVARIDSERTGSGRDHVPRTVVNHSGKEIMSRSGSIRSKTGDLSTGTIPKQSGNKNRQRKASLSSTSKDGGKLPNKSPQSKKKGVTIPEKSFAQDILTRMIPGKSQNKSPKPSTNTPKDRPPRGILKSTNRPAGQTSDSSGIYCDMVPALKGSLSGLSTGSGCRVVYRTDSTCQVDMEPGPAEDNVSLSSARSAGQLSRNSSVGGRSATSIHIVPRVPGTTDHPTHPASVRFETRLSEEDDRDESSEVALRHHHGNHTGHTASSRQDLAEFHPEVAEFRRSIAGFPPTSRCIETPEEQRVMSLQRGSRHRAKTKPPPPPRVSSRPEGVYGTTGSVARTDGVPFGSGLTRPEPLYAARADRDMTCPHGYPVHPLPPGPDPLERYVPGQAESPDPSMSAGGQVSDGTAPVFPVSATGAQSGTFQSGRGAQQRATQF